MEFYLKRWNRYQRYYNEEQKEKVYQELTKLTEEYELLSIEGFAILKEVILGIFKSDPRKCGE